MPTTTRPSGVTFPVDEVTPVAEALPEVRAHEAAKWLLGPVESCSDYHATVVEKVHYHPLLAAVHTAFSQHRPLVLSPDAVWLTVAQGVAHHLRLHGEQLRSRFVSHQGKINLVFTCRGWVEGSPENPWAEAFESWAGQIRDHVGTAAHDTLACDFSTTGPVERAASHVVMMDVFDRYFHYHAYCVCGVPEVTLEGTTDDWRRLSVKAAALGRFDLDWWLPHLLPVCEQFVRASRGDIDPEHWRGICKLRGAYGGDIINGWVAKLFPYIRSFIGGPCERRNPIFETGEGFQTLVAPGGLSRVPFTWHDAATGRTRRMEAVGGFLGVAQDRDTLALRPKAGWAVCPAAKFDVLLDRLAAEHATYPGATLEQRTFMPEDFCAFYHRTDGADLFGRDEAAAVRIAPFREMQSLDWGEDPNALGSFGPDGRSWHRFARLTDGRWLAINLDVNKHNAPWRNDPELKKREREIGYSLFAPVCLCSEATRNSPGKNPVVALSFTELLESLLDSGGKPAWLAPGFTGYGNAEVFTRRK